MTSRGPNGETLGEMLMLSEYVAHEYPGARAFLRLGLGTIETVVTMPGLEAADLGQFKGLRRYADAVIILPTELILLEAKMRAEPGAIAQLGLYARLVPLTPELQPYLDRPLVKELVFAIPDPVVSLLAADAGVRIKTYRPAWLAQWSAERNRRKSRVPRTGGLVPD